MRVKICGITTVTDALLAESLGADYIGMIFAKDSKRYISKEQAKKITATLTTAVPVGVFTEDNLSEVLEVCREAKIKTIQTYFPVVESLSGITVWEVILVEDELDQQRIEQSSASKIVLDASHNGEFGGKGLSFDWNLLPEKREKIILSGGINLKNVAKAINSKPFALDVCSGVEVSPGVKDAEKLKQLFSIRDSDVR